MTLYRIDAYASTATATNITPTGDFAPDYPYALAVDPTDTVVVQMVADDGTDQNWFSSDDSGATWTDSGATAYSYRGLKVASPYLVAFGSTVIRFSDDDGSTASDKLGDWSDGLGSPGVIRGMWIAL